MDPTAKAFAPKMIPFLSGGALGCTLRRGEAGGAAAGV